MSVSESSKHMIQISQLLEERSMSFSFCLNKADLLVLCGMTLLYQSIELKKESRLMKDNEKLANAVAKTVGQIKASTAYDFRRVASLLINMDEPQSSLPTPPGNSPDPSIGMPSQKESPAPKPRRKSSQHLSQPQQYSIGRHASVSEADLLSQQEKLKKMTRPSITTIPGSRGTEPHRSSSRSSLDSARPNAASLLQRRDQRLSMSQAAIISHVSPSHNPNLDYLSLGNPLTHSPSSSVQSNTPQQHSNVVSPGTTTQTFYTPIQVSQKSSSGGISVSEWDTLLEQMDGAHSNLYDSIYGGPQVSLDTPVTSAGESSWSPDSLDLSTFNLGDFAAPQGSSLSEESLSSASGGDDFSLDFREFSVGHGAMVSGEGFVMENIPRDGNYL